MTKTIVILHGWRLTGQKYQNIQKIFEQHGFTVYSPDLPGSGSEKLTKPIMKIDDYIDFVVDYFQKHTIKKAIVIGHSFGGRVGAKLAATHPELVEKLILTGAPLIKQQLPFRKKVLVYFAKFVKKIVIAKKMRKLLYYILGEWDYYKTTPEIRETFKAIIAEDIAPNLSQITVPTCIIWGGEDTFVGKSLGRQIASQIPGSTYKEIPHATHKLPYEYPEKFAGSVLSWVQ